MTAKSLFELAYKHQGKFTVSGPFYSSSGFQDELAWAAAWYVCMNEWSLGACLPINRPSPTVRGKTSD